MTSPPTYEPCVAAEVVRRGLDPLTGRMFSFNYVPVSAWAGLLCDLVLAGALADQDGRAALSSDTPARVHPLAAAALDRLAPHLPCRWRHTFAPQLIDINAETKHVREYLVETGVWIGHRTIGGRHYTDTRRAGHEAARRDPLRSALIATLNAIDQIDLTSDAASGTALISSAADLDEPTRRALLAVTAAADAYVAQARLRPPVTGSGVM